MKNSKKLALSLALSFAILGTSSSFAASSRVNLDVNTTSSSFSEKTLNLKQDQALKEEVLAEVRAIRSRLWDENILYTYDENANSKNEHLQDIAKEYGYKDKDAYVNGLTWSNDLERIAIQRAYEQTITGLSHQRPDGSSYNTAKTPAGIYPGAENLASSTEAENPKKAFGQWSFDPSARKNNKSEYQFLKEAKGVLTADNGHLHLILDPELKHIGFSAINTDQKWNYAVTIFDFERENVNQDSVNLVGPHSLYIGDIKDAPKKEASNEKAKPSKKLSADTLKRLKNSIAEAKKSIAGAQVLMDTMPKFAKVHGDKINALIESSQKIIERGEKILAAY